MRKDEAMSRENKSMVKKMDLRLITPSLKNKFPVHQKSEIKWISPNLSGSFFCLNANLNISYLIGLLFSFVIFLIVFSQVPLIWSFLRKKHIALQIISAFTAVGICWGDQFIFYMSFRTSSKL